LRNIAGSEWLREPGLDVVETVEAGPARNAQFKIFAQQMSEESESATDEGAVQ
jgi:hypothetical protein